MPGSLTASATFLRGGSSTSAPRGFAALFSGRLCLLAASSLLLSIRVPAPLPDRFQGVGRLGDPQKGSSGRAIARRVRIPHEGASWEIMGFVFYGWMAQAPAEGVDLAASGWRGGPSV
jgi:hypothetical protein